ncbi:MAG: FecR domain-containing protein [Bradyrhizobium sp.]
MMLSSTGSRFGKPGASVARRRLSFALSFLGCLLLASPAGAYAVPSAIEDGPAPSAVDAALRPTRLAQTQPAPLPTPLPTPAPAPARPAAAPSAARAPADEPIGNVATLTGTATVIRNKDSLPLKLQDDIFLNDVLQTSTNSTLGVTFNDATTFNLTANAKITVDNYIYEDGGKKNSALFDVTRGTVAFVAAAVAKTGDMKITTPSASLGIRGTTGLVEVSEGANAAGGHNIKLYPDPDGRVGHIDVSDRSGNRLGSLTQGSSGFTIRPSAGGRVTATPLVISPQQAARDQGIVRQVHAAQVVGRQVVTQQRALRQANPNRNNPRGNQPGQQRQNNLPQRPGSPQQPGTPQKPASPNKPAQPGQSPASPNKPGQQGQPQPQQQQAPGLQRQPNAPGLRQGGSPNRPALLPKRPAPPKGKPPKEKKR